MPERADVLIIGAGAAGGVAAARLARGGVDVVCLEQGGWVNASDYPAERRELELDATKRWALNPNTRASPWDYPCEVSESDVHPLMFNAVGGSTIHYTAIWTRLRPSDFAVRTLDGVADDWPITYEELLPHYEVVDAEFGVSGTAGDPAYPAGSAPPHPAFPLGPSGITMARGMNTLGWHWWPATNAMPSRPVGTRSACMRRGTCLWGCVEGAKGSTDVTHWPLALQHGARLVTHARVREITTDERGRATGAIYLDRDGVEHHQAASIVILAANGVGTARLLLLSASGRHPSGLANSSGLVGKRLMTHPSQTVLGTYDDDLGAWIGPSGAAIVSSEFGETDAARGFLRGSHWELIPTGPPLMALAMAGHGALTLAEGWGMQFHRLSADVIGRSIAWAIAADDLPDEDNAVTLDPELSDSSGIPAPRIRYRISEMVRRNLAFARERACQSHLASGARHVHDQPEWPESGWHLLGTARMGNDPASSVVDRDCRAHDVPNLYIVDGSVFVTGGSVNPTATICALAHRCAEHLLDAGRLQDVPG